MTRKTRDGIRISNIEKAIRSIEDITLRCGSKHATILNHPDMRPCPLAKSTHARRNVVPWLKQITEYSSNEIYSALTQGSSLYVN